MTVAAVRTGSQTPRIQSFPLYHTTAGDDAIDLAAVAGLNLDPWQQHILRASLGERSDGRWSSFRVAINVPRQNGKNALLEARELAGLFLFGEKLIIHSAHEYATARESMLALMSRIKATPDLLEHIKGFEGDPDRDFSGMKTGNDPGITLRNGNRLAYRARSKGSGRGFTGDLVILDEAYALKLDEMAALLPTMAAKSISGNPQVWFTSSAGMPDSTMLNTLKEQGTRGEDRLAYFEWSADDDAKADDVDAWYQANPGLGYRISEEFVRDELTTLTEDGGTEEQFKRERLGIWAKLGGEAVISPALWSELGNADAQPNDDSIVFAVDVSPARDSASISLVSLLDDETVHAEVIDQRVGTSWVGERLQRLVDRWHPDTVVAVAGSAAESLIPTWRREGVRVRLITFREYNQACGVLYDTIMQRRLVHIDDPVLTGALEGAKQKWRADGSGWYWDRKSDTDITPLVAVTVAMAGLEKKRPKRAAAAGQTNRKALVL